MSIILPPVITSWETPGWASLVRDGGDPITYELNLGSVGEVAVSVIQRDDVQAAGGLVSVARHPAYILVGGEQLTPAQAGQVMVLLQQALALIEGKPGSGAQS